MTNVARNNPVSRQAWKVDRRWQQVIIRVKYVEHGSREPTAGKSSPCRTSIAKFLLWRRRRRRRRRRISGVVAVGALSYTSGHVDRQGGGRGGGGSGNNSLDLIRGRQASTFRVALLSVCSSVCPVSSAGFVVGPGRPFVGCRPGWSLTRVLTRLVATVREQRGPLFPRPRVKTVPFRRFRFCLPAPRAQLFISEGGQPFILIVEKLTHNPLYNGRFRMFEVYFILLFSWLIVLEYFVNKEIYWKIAWREINPSFLVNRGKIDA